MRLFLWPVLLVSALSAPLFLFLPLFDDHAIDLFFFVLACGMAPLTLIAVVAILHSIIKRPNEGGRKQGRQIAQMLASLEDVRTIGPLLDALKLEDRHIHQSALDALITLLPRLRPEDAEWLNAEQRVQLCGHLSRITDRLAKEQPTPLVVAPDTLIAFRVAILQAFAHIGDSTALPIVERLARQETKNIGQKRIQAAAAACLPLLQIRVEEERNPRTLLRASAPAERGAATLLRAAAGAQETDPTQLLRPGSSSR